MTRIAVLDADKCKVKKCDQICVRFCPMVRSHVEAVRVEGDKAVISGNALQRLRHMRQEMPVQSHQHREPARRVGEGLQSPFRRERFQAFQATDAFAWHGFGLAGTERHRQNHHAQSAVGRD